MDSIPTHILSSVFTCISKHQASIYGCFCPTPHMVIPHMVPTAYFEWLRKPCKSSIFWNRCWLIFCIHKVVQAVQIKRNWWPRKIGVLTTKKHKHFCLASTFLLNTCLTFGHFDSCWDTYWTLVRAIDVLDISKSEIHQTYFLSK